VTNRVFANLDGETGGNVGIIILDDQAFAVDAQYPVSARVFRQRISSLTTHPLTHLLLTHYHGDHVFVRKSLKTAKSLPISTLKK